AISMRGEIDVEFPHSHQVTSWRIGISNAIVPQSRWECTLGVGEATGRLPNPAPGSWTGALLAASRPQDGERYRASWRGVAGSRPQPAALRRSGPRWGRRWDHESCRRAGSEKQAYYEGVPLPLVAAIPAPEPR